MVIYYDKRNRENIDKLAPATKKLALRWYDEWIIPNGVEILIYETIRTTAKQRENVAKGASQTMKSYHLVGQALDFVPIVDGKEDWNGYNTPRIQKALEYAKKLGFTWGGDWKGFVDSPHLQYEYKGYGSDIYETITSSPPPSTLSPTGDGVAIVPFKGVLKRGSTGKEVERVQRALGETVDGIFGAHTESAVRAYQDRHLLEVDGIVGINTWNMIF